MFPRHQAHKPNHAPPQLHNRAAAVAAKMAGMPGLHLVPADIPGHPPIAARRAGSALALRRLQCNHRPAALLVFLAAAAWTRIVSPDSHSAL